jgi:hypothetical protein
LIARQGEQRERIGALVRHLMRESDNWFGIGAHKNRRR